MQEAWGVALGEFNRLSIVHFVVLLVVRAREWAFATYGARGFRIEADAVVPGVSRRGQVKG